MSPLHTTGATHVRNGSTRHKHFALNSLELTRLQSSSMHRCNEFHSDFVPLALKTFGGTSEKFDKLLEKLSSKAPNSTISPTLFCLIAYWKKRISTVLQISNVAIISQAYRRFFNFESETIERDNDMERTFN